MVSRKKDIKVNNPIEPKGHYSHYKKRTISICAQRPLLASSLVKSANFCFNLIHQTPHNTKITRFDRSPLTNKTERDVEGGRAGDGRSVLRRTESLPSRRDPPKRRLWRPKGHPYPTNHLQRHSRSLQLRLLW